jgi:hypothetical protein
MLKRCGGGEGKRLGFDVGKMSPWVGNEVYL